MNETKARNRNQAWDAIQRFTNECGGDPSSNVHGATGRQGAAVDIERALDAEYARGLREAAAYILAEEFPDSTMQLARDLRAMADAAEKAP